MSIEWFIYLAEIVPSLGVLIGLVGFCCVIYGGCSTLAEEAGVAKPYTDKPKLYIITGAVAIAVGLLFPTQKTMYMMAGAHYGMEALQSETAQKVAKLLNGKLDEELAKLREGR